MTVFAHALSASVLSLMIARVDPSETGLVMTALLVPASLDLDHLVLLGIKRKTFREEGLKGNLHKARSFMHEMLGVLLVGILALYLGFVDRKASAVVFFSYLIHVIEDMVMGKSYPFTPVVKTESFLFKFGIGQKIFADVVLIIISLVLWANYLRG